MYLYIIICCRLLSSDLSAEPKNKTQEFAQNEIIRLAAESLALQVNTRVLDYKRDPGGGAVIV